ncbi:MFS transporter [Bifidobacterium sp. ESL0784]|uniref:MFS transporter n=1 Tax=Bifidobacterium sp. ESL0784 TaxID=2983231 RepID=UPI0023F8FC47|nr:MFS transporter [Bifidobacterium sp. ESL0784]MDF7640239.1 MFS transporter [Bifidobacterium sp. ESL0784]
MQEERVSTQTKLSIAAAALLSFTGILTETSLNVCFPTMTREFGLPLSTIQLLTSGYLLMVTIVMSTSSFLLKRFDTRLLFRWAIIVSLVGTVLCCLPLNYWLLLLGRLLQAAATGVSTPLMINVILALVPVSRRGTYVGIANMVTSFAPALGPTYGGLINHYFSWRIIFVFTLPLLVIAWILGETNLRLKAEGAGKSFDGIGLVLLSFFMVSFTEIFDQFGAGGGWSYKVAIAICAAAALLGLFIWRCLASKSPLLNLRLFRKPIVGLRGANYAILQFINIGSSFLLPVFAENFLGIDSLTAGLMLLPGSLLGAFIAPFVGKLYDRRGPTLVLLISNISLIIGATALWAMTGKATVAILTLLYMFLRAGFNFGYGNTMSDASKFVSGAQQTDFNSLFNVLQQYAGSLGTTVLSASLSLSEAHIPHNVKAASAVGATNAFALVIVLALVALCITLVSIKVRKNPSVEMQAVEV